MNPSVWSDEELMTTNKVEEEEGSVYNEKIMYYLDRTEGHQAATDRRIVTSFIAECISRH